MIYTVTLNPAIDYVVQVDQLTIGEVNRMKSDVKLPGGKGINVSRILQRIDCQTTALGFLGGFTGDFIQRWLEKEGIISSFTPIANDTRINIKLKAEEETEINGLGPKITEEEIIALKKQFQPVTAKDTVVLSGSIPASLPRDFYQELITLITAKGAEFVIDTTGQALISALASQPLVVKPNNFELAEIYHTHFEKLTDIFPYGEQMLKDGAKHVIVSLAGDGALLFTNNGIYQSNVLKRPVKNSVGAGDSMIAGFVGYYEKTKDAVEAFKWGVACGSGTAFSEDLAQTELIEELLKEVIITKIK